MQGVVETQEGRENTATVTDIARRANVSPATVSRVINRPKTVSELRVQAVRKAMKSLDYVPTPIGNRRGPKSRRPPVRSIGVWFVGARQTPGMDWFHDQVVQLGSSLAQYRIKVSMLYSATNQEIPIPILQSMVDGVIVQGAEPTPECWSRLSQLPTVWFMTRRSPTYPGDYVEPDNQCNGQMAADFLESLGHRQAVVLNSDPDYSAVALRTEAFCSQCSRLKMEATVVNNQEPGDSTYLETFPSDDVVRGLVESWMEMSPRPTGVYLPSDHFCGSFLRAALNRGLKPGKDFDLILGNKSPLIYQNLSYQPAAIDINLPGLVKTVLNHLIWRIDNFESPGRVGITVAPSLHAAPTLSSDLSLSRAAAGNQDRAHQ